MMEETLAWVLPVLKTTPERWHRLAQVIPPELFALPAAQGEWSALECLQHIIDTEALLQSRVKAFLDGRDLPAFNPDQQGTKVSSDQSGVELSARFEEMRVESLQMLKTITPSDLKREANHAELGPVTLNQMLNEWAGHDLMHTVQAERALMQPFIKECGPWLVYFQDHVVTSGK